MGVVVESIDESAAHITYCQKTVNQPGREGGRGHWDIMVMGVNVDK